jgi:hypothetical protein
MAILQFDASKVAPATGQLDPVPTGWYIAMMDQSELKPTKDGLGSYLECRFSLLDGVHKDRKMYSRLNIKNTNPVAVEIAYKELSAIAHAVGVIQVNDSAELHNKPMKIRVKLRPASADGQYEANNEVVAYRSVNDQSVGNGPATPAGTVAAAVAPSAVPPAAVVAPAAVPASTGWAQPAAAQPWAAAPAVAAPVAAPVVAAPPVATPPVAAAPATIIMTAKANGATAEAFRAQGWTDDQMVEQGYATRPQMAVPAAAAPVAPPAVPGVPPGVVAAQGANPPWANS